MSIESTKAKHEDRLMALPGVVGVGIGEKDGEPVIRVYLAARSASRGDIPEVLDGWPTDLEVIGTVSAEE